MNPLQDLKDIRTPASIENWPPAYGWWLLVFLLVVGICLLTIWLLKGQKVRRVKHQALQALKHIDGANLDSVPQLNQLLKRVALHYFPNQNVQQMYGAQWTAFLIQTLPNNKAKEVSETFESMQQTLYQPHISENSEFPHYSKSVETWIKHALPPNKHMVTQLEQSNA
jgi:hypothetical protein